MVRFSARSSPNENGSSRPGAAAPSGSTRALRPRSASSWTSGSASPLGSITATVTPRSASCKMSSNASVVFPPPGSPVMAMAVGRFSAAASSGSKWTTARARPRVSPIYGPTQPCPLLGRSPRSTVAVGTPPAIVYSGWRCTYELSRTRSPGSDSRSRENWSPVELTTSMPMSR